MVYTVFLGKQGKRVYTIGPERRVYTIEPQTQKKKKRRVSTVVVYTFFFLEKWAAKKERKPAQDSAKMCKERLCAIPPLVVPPFACHRLSGLPNANAKSQRFSNAISQIAPLPPVVALNRSFKSQIAARYAAFWHAIPPIALASFL